ncbi:hypothetical protein PG991_006083 [Apiospora marii]|uniref:CCHC-type domain-containing protein n=1 Tax=Apiospora marii TaxID=335849 RepID=A0ABR1SB30_9PEZI
MADFHPASQTQTDWAAEWPKFKFNKNGDLILPDHLETTVRSTLTCQLYYSKHTPALQCSELFIPSFMIELHNRLGNEPLVNWIYSTPHYQQPGAALTEYDILKTAARDHSLNPTHIVALVLTNGQSTSLPQTMSAVEAPAETMHDVADINAGQTPTHTMEEDVKPQEQAFSSKDVTCANCQRSGHELRDCIGPVDDQGWLAGCPFHNTTQHLYHECNRRKSLTAERRANEDQDFLLYYRQNKPPIKCTIDWTKIYNERHPLLIALPWTPGFAREQSKKATGFRGQLDTDISWQLHKYEWIGNPDLEARHRMKDPATDDLAKKILTMSGVKWDPNEDFYP